QRAGEKLSHYIGPLKIDFNDSKAIALLGIVFVTWLMVSLCVQLSHDSWKSMVMEVVVMWMIVRL
ncbi:MAG: hypothetical protein NZ961_25400, partial [Candidatus Poribacteria bacterium]|nr:hypothetical protein [Candidatus Poribacteria bacterium]